MGGTMTCPHRGGNESCAFVPHARITDYGCSICQSEWTSGPPTADTLTPTLRGIIGLTANQPGLPAVVQPARGLGDTIASILHAVGIRKRRGCGCGRRQAWLNRIVPYRT